jgi:SecD/SecF fusion protein
MTDRRRNLFILLLVAGLLAASFAVIFTKQTRLGLDLQGGVSLTYQAKPTKQAQVSTDSIDRAIDIMRKRVDQLGVAEPEIQRSGTDQIDVSLPDVSNADEAAKQVGTTAQLHFYDWEKNVLGPGCKPAPANPDVTGGASAGSTAAALSQYDAVTRAAQCAPSDRGNETTTGSLYVVNDKTKRVLVGPEEDRKSLDQAVRQKKIQLGKDVRVVKVPQGTIVVRAEGAGGGAPPPDRWYVLRDDPALSGTEIKNPEQNFDNGPGGSGQPNVTFEFTSKGRTAWQKTTREIAQRGQNQFFGGDPRSAFQHFAIVLDNEVISAPYIDFQQNPDGIDGGNGSEISGGFTIGTAQELANLLKSGALPIKLDLISSSQVSATLGKQALDQGLIAGIAGFAVVALFLVAFYRVLGLIAVSALAVYAIFLFALIKLIPITMTLPGIAGLILTIGVAADANIVIFERVKEEIRAGRSVPAAIAAGYRKGLSAIVDANVVTFMVAFILFILATAGIKGFAFTLGVGTLVAFFTAVVLTQAVLGLAGRSKLITHPAAFGGANHARRALWEGFDFMGASRWFFSFSGVILAIGALAIGGKGLNFGIDFESGTRIKTELVRPADENGVRNVLAQSGESSAEVQRLSGSEIKGGNGFQISTEELAPRQRDQIEQGLRQKYGIRSFNFDSIGPTFGQTVARTALIAIIASLVVISAYIALRFEWKYAVPVLIALMHDILITGGVYALTGREVTASTVAALLTILGFSLYDTIIVFDRIRENVPRMPRAAFSQIVNRSMSEVLTRSLATSFCTLLPILALYFFGGETLKDFAFALIVGTVSGAYSSIFIASPVLTHWKEREPVYARRRQRIEAQLGRVPAYATAVAGAPADVEPDLAKRSGRRITAPETPDRQVSRQEFDEMVRDLHAEPPPTRTAVREPEPEPEPEPAPPRDPSADADPSEVFMKDERNGRAKQRRPRNKKHGRPR